MGLSRMANAQVRGPLNLRLFYENDLRFFCRQFTG